MAWPHHINMGHRGVLRREDERWEKRTKEERRRKEENKGRRKKGERRRVRSKRVGRHWPTNQQCNHLQRVSSFLISSTLLIFTATTISGTCSSPLAVKAHTHTHLGYTCPVCPAHCTLHQVASQTHSEYSMSMYLCSGFGGKNRAKTTHNECSAVVINAPDIQICFVQRKIALLLLMCKANSSWRTQWWKKESLERKRKRRVGAARTRKRVMEEQWQHPLITQLVDCISYKAVSIDTASTVIWTKLLQFICWLRCKYFDSDVRVCQFSSTEAISQHSLTWPHPVPLAERGVATRD